jgi:tRNA-Thr(GGU) m(6)t(6)A37 methyltransferase TsaA
MMEGDRELTLRPIGRVVQGLAPSVAQGPALSSPEGRPRPGDGDRREEDAADIEIDAAWAGALDGIEEFSHIWVVWWLDRSPSGGPLDSLRVRPERREEMPLVGILATRSPRRPNPIALTAVRLLERQGSRLRVQGLDAYEGTPILDIKPYLRRGDLIPEATTPGWLEQLWCIQDEERDL